MVKSHKFKRLRGAVWQLMLICVSSYVDRLSFMLTLLFLMLLCKDN